MSGTTGVVICTCGDQLYSKKEAEGLASRITFSGGEGVEIMIQQAACSESFLTTLAKTVKEKGMRGLVVTGCHPGKVDEIRERISAQCSLPASSVRGVSVKAQPEEDNKGPFGLDEALLKNTLKSIQQEIAFLQGSEPVKVKKAPLHQGVLIIGGGIAGTEAAGILSGLGYPVTLVEKREKGETVLDLEGVTVKKGYTLARLSGDIGSFSALLEGPDGGESLECGALIVSPGFGGDEDPAHLYAERYPGADVVALSSLESWCGKLPRIPRVRTIGIVLDVDFDETKASTEMALKTALAVQKQDVHQVMLFCRDIRVGSVHLEQLYDDAREAGVVIVKYGERVSISGTDDGSIITVRDAIMEKDVSFLCDGIGISPYGLSQVDFSEIAGITGVHLDSIGRMQDNNIHLLPVETNIPGIFVAGACRGTLYRSQVTGEARAAALAVHKLLSQKRRTVELANAQVDADKCALCLTCIRACPHGAMHVNREEGVAESSPLACQRCGICAGECPAKAIELPGYTDTAVLARLG